MIRTKTGGCAWQIPGNKLFTINAEINEDHPDAAQTNIVELEALLMDAPMYWDLLPKDNRLPGNIYGYVGYAGPLQIIFIGVKGTSIVDTLYALEESEGENLPGILVSIVLAASELPLPWKQPVNLFTEKLSSATADVIATLAAIQTLAAAMEMIDHKDGKFPRMNRAQMQESLPKTTRNAIRPPDGKVNRARWMLRFATHVWDTDYMTPGVPVDITVRGFIEVASEVGQWLYREHTKFLAAGRWTQSPRLHHCSTWIEACTWVYGHADREAITAFEWLPIDDDSYSAMNKLPTLDYESAMATIERITKEANDHQVYLPNGVMHLELPPSLKAWHAAGLNRLCISTKPDHIWACAITTEGKRTKTVYWDPKVNLKHELKQTDQDDLGPWLYIAVTLATFWRDLVVAGPEIIVRQESKSNGLRTHWRDAENLRTETARQATILNLPRVTKSVIMDGSRTWSTPEDHERIEKTRIYVKWLSGFKRRLRPGHHRSQEIQDFLDDNGIHLEDGYTFVRPLNQEETTTGEQRKRPVVARARGLQTLALLLEGNA